MPLTLGLTLNDLLQHLKAIDPKRLRLLEDLEKQPTEQIRMRALEPMRGTHAAKEMWRQIERLRKSQSKMHLDDGTIPGKP